MNEVLSLVHNRNGLVLYEVPEIPSHVQINIRAPGMVPLLALLPNSLDDIALAHSLILHVHELCAKVSGEYYTDDQNVRRIILHRNVLLPGLLRNYSSVGLFEALCKTLSVLAHLQNQTTDVCGHDSREILFQDLYDFFRLIGLRFVTAHGPENWKTVDDFLHLLLFMAIEDKCRYAHYVNAKIKILQHCFFLIAARVSNHSDKLCAFCWKSAYATCRPGIDTTMNQNWTF